MSTLKIDNINELTTASGINCTAKSVYNSKDKINNVTPSAGVLTVDYTLGQLVDVNWNANITDIALNNFPAGGSMTMYLVQDATGGRTVTFPASFKAAGGTAPTMSFGVNQYDILVITSKDGVNFDYGLFGANFS